MAAVIAALCRHGVYAQPADTPSAHLLYPLTPEGEAQAAALGQELRALAQQHGWRIHPVIDSSPLQRAYQTASIAARALSQAAGAGSFEVQEYDALMERSVGAAANLTVSQIEALVTQDPRYGTPPPKWKSTSAYRLPFPGAESLLEAGKRCAAHLRARSEALRASGGETILKVFVGHGAAFRHAAAALGAMPLTDVAKLSMHYARPVCLAVPERGAAQEAWSSAAGEWKKRSREAID